MTTPTVDMTQAEANAYFDSVLGGALKRHFQRAMTPNATESIPLPTDAERTRMTDAQHAWQRRVAASMRRDAEALTGGAKAHKLAQAAVFEAVTTAEQIAAQRAVATALRQRAAEVTKDSEEFTAALPTPYSLKTYYTEQAVNADRRADRMDAEVTLETNS